MRKIINIVLILALLTGLCVPALAATPTPVFTDVSSDKWYYTWVTKAAQQGWVSGVGDGRFDPGGAVTHAQFALLLSKALYTSDIDSQPKGAQWWTAGCEVADRHGLFKGTDMEHRSNWDAVAGTPIEREQMAQMMYNALVDSKAKLPSYDEYAEVALGINDIMDVDNYDAVATCYAIKLLSGNGNGYFSPQEDMTRAQACVVLCNIYGYVTGDVVGSVNPEQPSQSETPIVTEKPSDAIGGHYNITAYDVPADTNKDGWITEAEVQAVLSQLRIDYPEGSPWGTNDYWSSPVMGSGIECAGFAYMVSDKIFGNLPKTAVPIQSLRIGDVLVNRRGNHTSVCIDTTYTLSTGTVQKTRYTTVDGNSNGSVHWGTGKWYDEWPASINDGVVYSRYPKE